MLGIFVFGELFLSRDSVVWRVLGDQRPFSREPSGTFQNKAGDLQSEGLVVHAKGVLGVPLNRKLYGRL